MSVNTTMENKIALNLKESGYFVDSKGFTNIFNDEATKMVHLAVLSLKTFSNVFYKDYPYIDEEDIEKIKNALLNYACQDSKSKLLKQELIENLNQFKLSLEIKHKKQVQELQKQVLVQRHILEELKIQEEKSTNLISKLLKISIQSSAKESSIKAQINMTSARLEKYSQQLEDLKTKGAIANEKEILVYQMQLKEKFSA